MINIFYVLILKCMWRSFTTHKTAVVWSKKIWLTYFLRKSIIIWCGIITLFFAYDCSRITSMGVKYELTKIDHSPTSTEINFLKIIVMKNKNIFPDNMWKMQKAFFLTCWIIKSLSCKFLLFSMRARILYNAVSVIKV